MVGLTDAGDPQANPVVPGQLVERYDYDPYGTPYVETWDSVTQAFVRQPDASSSYGNPFLWTGQRWDASVRLYHFWARSYSPHLGRWLQRDPLGYIDGPNLYEYVRSAPTVLVDPLGLMPPGGYPPYAPSPGGDDDGGGSGDEGGSEADPCGDGGEVDQPQVPAEPPEWQGSREEALLLLQQLLALEQVQRDKVTMWWISMLIEMMAEDHARWRAGIQDFIDHYFTERDPDADYPEYHSEGPIEDFAKDCFWRVIHSDEVLAEMSYIRILVESVGVSTVVGAGGYFAVTYAIAAAEGQAGWVSLRIGLSEGSSLLHAGVGSSSGSFHFLGLSGGMHMTAAMADFTAVVVIPMVARNPRALPAMMEAGQTAYNCVTGVIRMVWAAL